MSDSTDLRPLFVDYAIGVISAEQLQSLEAAIREDSSLRRDFIEYMNIDSALGDMAALSETELEECETT
jgi:anti-sigma-K factor RskA